MSKEHVNDAEYAVYRNFRHKSHVSSDSVESAALNTLRNYGKGSKGDPVVIRKNALEWVKNTLELANSKISEIRMGEINGASDKEIEQAKLAVLESIGWKYRGSFHPEKNRAQGFPELSFTISVRRDNINEEIFYYFASYGIVRDDDNDRIGSYSSFLTLDDVVTYLLEQLSTVGKSDYSRRRYVDKIRAHQDKEKSMSKAELAKRGSISTSDDRKRKIKKDCLDEFTNNILPEENVRRRISELKSASDIFTLPDLLRIAMIPMAKNNLKESEEHQHMVNQAKQATHALSNDTFLSGISDVSEIEENEGLEPTVRGRKEISEDISHREVDDSSTSFTPPLPIRGIESLSPDFLAEESKMIRSIKEKELSLNEATHRHNELLEEKTALEKDVEEKRKNLLDINAAIEHGNSKLDELPDFEEMLEEKKHLDDLRKNLEDREKHINASSLDIDSARQALLLAQDEHKDYIYKESLRIEEEKRRVEEELSHKELEISLRENQEKEAANELLDYLNEEKKAIESIYADIDAQRLALEQKEESIESKSLELSLREESLENKEESLENISQVLEDKTEWLKLERQKLALSDTLSDKNNQELEDLMNKLMEQERVLLKKEESLVSLEKELCERELLIVCQEDSLENRLDNEDFLTPPESKSIGIREVAPELFSAHSVL